MLAERKLSSKINYDVLRGLKSEDTTGADDLDASTTLSIKSETGTDVQFVNTTAIQRNNDRAASVKEMPVVYESGPLTSKLTKRPSKR